MTCSLFTISQLIVARFFTPAMLPNENLRHSHNENLRHIHFRYFVARLSSLRRYRKPCLLRSTYAGSMKNRVCKPKVPLREVPTTGVKVPFHRRRVSRWIKYFLNILFHLGLVWKSLKKHLNIWEIFYNIVYNNKILSNVKLADNNNI